jgi:hypothetical protein
MNDEKLMQAPPKREPVARADWGTRLNKSKTADYAIVILALLPAIVMYFNRYSPEAAVYFTYFKNFFAKPFSFQPGVVEFGAASPLHVLLYAPIHSLFGDHWILAGKLLNFLLVGLGVVALNRAIKGGTKSVLLTSLLVVLSTGMLLSVSQLFETGLAFFAMALLYHDLAEKNFERALLICGTLYLIRAELFVVGVAVAFYIMIQSEKSKALLPWLAAGCAPALIYHGYMLAATGTLVPTGVMSTLIGYVQEPASWLSRTGTTWAALWSAEGLIYMCGAVLLLVMLAEWSVPRYSKELLLLAPLLIVYTLVPPGAAVIRYLVPVLPALIALMARYIEKELKVQHSYRALLVSLALAHLFGAATLSGMTNPDRNTVLLSDLSNSINRLAGPQDHVLLCDIQGQYGMAAPCHALAGNVGDDMVDVLLRRETLNEFIHKKNIRFVITSDALGNRPLYANTLLSELSSLDPQVAPGDTIHLGGLAFEKQFSNSAFMRRAGRTETVQASAFPSMDDIEPRPLWNSVYKVLEPGSGATAAVSGAVSLHEQMGGVSAAAKPTEDSLSPAVPAPIAANPGP